MYLGKKSDAYLLFVMLSNLKSQIESENHKHQDMVRMLTGNESNEAAKSQLNFSTTCINLNNEKLRVLNDTMEQLKPLVDAYLNETPCENKKPKNSLSDNLMVCQQCLSAIESKEGPQASKTHSVDAESEVTSVCDWCKETGNDVLYELIPETSKPILLAGQPCSDEELEDVMKKAEETFESLSESEKEALVQGVEAILDYSEHPPREDYEIYKLIIAERSKKNGTD